MDASGRIHYGGPGVFPRGDPAGHRVHGMRILNEQGEMAGSLVILEADDLEAAKATCAMDPYVLHGVFEEYDVLETRPLFPRGN